MTDDDFPEDPRIGENFGLLSVVKRHAEEKYRVLGRILAIFSTGMKAKWRHRIYLDLFSGPGASLVNEKDVLLAASPQLALNVRDPFTQYIFVDSNPLYCASLPFHVRQAGAENITTILEGDCNDLVPRILQLLPAGGNDLSLCLLDPYGMRSLAFDTIRALAVHRMDFLLLVPTYMDAHRNVEAYGRPGDSTIERFTGRADWRRRWAAAPPHTDFGRFVLDEMNESMRNLGFQPAAAYDALLIRSAGTNAPLYHLAYYSKHPLGMQFWAEAKKDAQLRLF